MDDAGFAGKFVGFAGLCGFAGYVACLCLCEITLKFYWSWKNNEIFLVLIAKGSGTEILVGALVMSEFLLGFVYLSIRSGDLSWWAELYRNAVFLIWKD